MMYSIFISTEAENDLKDIYEYIAFVLQAPEAAKGQYQRLKEKIWSLKQFPFRYKKYVDYKGVVYNFHLMPVDNYSIAYSVNENEKIVEIGRVFYGKRKIENLFEH